LRSSGRTMTDEREAWDEIVAEVIEEDRELLDRLAD
jgi:hypothetical protein